MIIIIYDKIYLGLICQDKRLEPCWLGISPDDDTCIDNIQGEYTAEICCATQGAAWGDKCTDCRDIRLQCKKVSYVLFPNPKTNIFYDHIIILRLFQRYNRLFIC